MSNLILVYTLQSLYEYLRDRDVYISYYRLIVKLI